VTRMWSVTDMSNANRERALVEEHYGVREIFWKGGNDRQSFTWVYEKEGQLTVRQRTVFSWDDDEIDDLAVLLDPEVFLCVLGEVRLGQEKRVQSLLPTIDGDTFLRLSDRGLAVDTRSISGMRTQLPFDEFFLDSYSVVENSEPRRRTARDILPGPAEEAIVRIAGEQPDILHSFSPREFETFVGAFLTHCGFSRVRLSRYVKDGGYDLYGVYCEGDAEHVVLIEVKHYTSRRVGLEVVDRINGVRDREKADKAIVVTNSSFSTEATRRYGAAHRRMALVDYERLVDLLSRGANSWIRTPADFWTRPRNCR